jgi:hypothetical protein
MKIANLPEDKLVDENRNLTPQWKLFLSELITQLQNNLSNEGIILPPQTTTDIALLTSSKSIGALIYDSTLDVAKVNLNGTFKTITTS